MPELSVIIPMHNGAATIGRALESLRGQRLSDWEAIVVDDGSTDAGLGAEIVAARAAEDARVRLVVQANGGVSRARNRGLDEARGRWVLLLDADDWMLPGGVDALVETACAPGARGGAVGTFEMVARGRGGAMERLSLEGPWSEELGLEHLLGGIFMTTHGHVVERRHYEEPGPLRFDVERRLIEDTDLWIRLAERGVRWRNCQRAVAAYLMRPDSRSVKFGAMLHDTIAVYTGAYERVRERQATGAGREGIEVTPQRLARLLGHAALGYATRLAISGDGRIDEAAGLVAGTPGTAHYTPRQMARAARHAVMFAVGARPRAEGLRLEEWGARLTAWWRRCEEAGWGPGGSAAEAAREFEEAGTAEAARVA